METRKSLACKHGWFLVIFICFLLLLMGFHSAEVIDRPTTHIITIVKMKFDPADLVVNKNDTVVWINKDFYQHDVTEMTDHK